MEPEIQHEILSQNEDTGFLSDEYFDLKSRIHDRLLDMVDLSKMDRMDPLFLKPEMNKIVDKILQEDSHSLPLNAFEREKLYDEILHEVLGFGPLEPLLQDPTVSDILVNTYKQVYVERFGKLETTDVRFFKREDIPEDLLGVRTTPRHINDAFMAFTDPSLPTVFD